MVTPTKLSNRRVTVEVIAFMYAFFGLFTMISPAANIDEFLVGGRPVLAGAFVLWGCASGVLRGVKFARIPYYNLYTFQRTLKAIWFSYFAVTALGLLLGTIVLIVNINRSLGHLLTPANAVVASWFLLWIILDVYAVEWGHDWIKEKETTD